MKTENLSQPVQQTTEAVKLIPNLKPCLLQMLINRKGLFYPAKIKPVIQYI